MNKLQLNSPLSMVTVFLALILSIGLLGCSDDDPNPNMNPGEIKMYVVDAPGDFDEVNIVVVEVSVHMSSGDTVSGWTVISDSTRTINLLRLTNGNYDILGTHRLDVGHYSQIRLKIGTGSNVVVDGMTHALEIPSGSQSGLKLNHSFDIEADIRYELTLDFDASQSIHLTGNDRYMMRPVIRIVPNLASGSISGMISPTIPNSRVYTLAGLDTVSTFTDVITGGFRLMVLPSGNYTLVIQPDVALYADSTITGISVAIRQNTNIGTIALRRL